MAEKSKPKDRGALYYPYIHVRNDNWLKATLLCFPYINRMVPDGYQVNDSSVAASFANELGRLGRNMLGRIDLDEPPIEHSQSVLVQRLKNDVERFNLRDRFSREAAADSYEHGEYAFQIHEHKFAGELLDLLQKYNLMWAPPIPVRGNASWWAVHPILGETIMSTNAVTLAKEYDLEIVTDSGPIHQALLGTTAEEVYDVLISHNLFGIPRTDTQKVNDLMRYVIITAFDLEHLSPQDIVKLNQHHGDLSALKTALLSQVEELGDMPNQELWNDVLAKKAKDVLDDWGTRSSILSIFSHIDGNDLFNEFKSAIKEIAPTLAAGITATALVGVLPGLAICAVFAGATLYTKWSKASRSYRFLSLVRKAGASHRHTLEGSPV